MTKSLSAVTRCAIDTGEFWCWIKCLESFVMTRMMESTNNSMHGRKLREEESGQEKNGKSRYDRVHSKSVEESVPFATSARQSDLHLSMLARTFLSESARP